MGDLVACVRPIHAGVGDLYRLGRGWQNIATSVKRWAEAGGDAHELTQAFSRTCYKLYNGKPGDDAIAVCMGYDSGWDLRKISGICLVKTLGTKKNPIPIAMG